MQHISLKQPEPGAYRYEAVSTIKINNEVTSKLFTSTNFTITVVEETDAETIVQIAIQNTYLEDRIKGRIEGVGNKLLLKINNTGIITAVIGGGDEYLNDGVSFINRHHNLYTMLFCGYLRTYELEETYELKPQIKKSGLFADEEIPLELYATVKTHANGNKGYQLDIQGIENREFDTGKLKALYQTAYPTANKDMDDYSYSYSPSFEVDINTGRITKMEMTVLEQTGSILMFMDGSIKQLNSEKNNLTHQTKNIFSKLKETLFGG
jgi:hypothetical protein